MKAVLYLLFLFFSLQTHAQIVGCTDVLANNYNENAVINDGSCLYSNVSIVPVTGSVLPIEMHETSGLLFYNDLLLTHNDDTDTNLYLFDPDSPADFSVIPIPSVTNKDWEDIAEDGHYIYIGDFGNNGSGNRTDLRIYRILKSELMNNPAVDTISFSYENQTDFSAQSPNNTDFDCEAFIVTNDRIYLFTKEWISKKTSVYELNKTPGTHIALLKDTWDVQGLITGADHLEDENLVVLSGYSVILQPFIYLLYDFQNDDFFYGNRRKIMLNLPFHQIEGITTSDGVNYFLSNERFSQGSILVDQKIHHLDLSSFLSHYLFDDALSILSDVSNEGFPVQLFPNPASESVTVRIPEERLPQVAKMEITDHSGRKLMEQRIEYSTTSIHLNSHLRSKAVYTILFKDERNTIISSCRLYFQ